MAGVYFSGLALSHAGDLHGGPPHAGEAGEFTLVTVRDAVGAAHGRPVHGAHTLASHGALALVGLQRGRGGGLN